jgi:outer membrane receptor protein involved in Fe transport
MLHATGHHLRRRAIRSTCINPGELYGPGYTIFDLKLGKNIRVPGQALNVGVDIYNLFNKEQVLTYQDNIATPVLTTRRRPGSWRHVGGKPLRC